MSPRSEHQAATREISAARLAAERLAVARARLDRLGAAVPSLPQEFRNAAAVLAGELQNHSPLGVVALVLGFAILGHGTEWTFRRVTKLGFARQGGRQATSKRRLSTWAESFGTSR